MDAMVTSRRLVELNHVITDGLVTYPGLPAPAITPFLTRADSRGRYAEGTEFAMDCISLIGNTGTYLDSPYHRFDGGTDLAGLDLAQLVDLPALVLQVADSRVRGIDATALTAIDPAVVAGAAVLLHTGDAARFGTPQYADDAAYLTRDGAELLVALGATLVGIDSINIDSVADGTRPAHTLLLAAGIPIVEHLTGLEQLPPSGARFSAVPPRVAGFGTFPVRAFAII
jgi:arylformamidase